MTKPKRSIGSGKDDYCCDDLVNDEIEDELNDSGDLSRKRKGKKPKISAEDSPSNTSAVVDGASSPTSVSKFERSTNPQHLVPRILPFSDGAPESSIVMKRLKDLCSMKEPTVNVGIEIVGAAYLLKLMTTKRPSCDDDHLDDDDKIGLAMKKAVKAAKLLFQADHLRNDVLQLVESQKLFDKDL